jgi:hypothetical protein
MNTATTPAESDTECAGCDRYIVGTPVYDADQLAYLGTEGALPFHSAACLAAYAESMEAGA